MGDERWREGEGMTRGGEREKGVEKEKYMKHISKMNKKPKREYSGIVCKWYCTFAPSFGGF